MLARRLGGTACSDGAAVEGSSDALVESEKATTKTMHTHSVGM